MARRFLPLLGALLIASPVVGQAHRTAVTFWGGGAMFGEMAAGSGATVAMEDGWLAGLQLEGWGNRFGFRLTGTATEHSVVSSVAPDGIMNMYAGTLDVLYRFRRPQPYRWFMPYLAVGAGATMYNAWGEPGSVGGQPYGPDPVITPMAVGALGFDIGGGAIALRVEAFDQVDILSPLQKADGSFYGPVQRIGASAGLSFRFGGSYRARRRAEEPQPEPEPVRMEPEPELEPEPVVEREPAPVVVREPEPAPPREDPRVQALMQTVESLSTRVAVLERRVRELAERPVVQAQPQPAARPGAERLYTVQIASFLAGQESRAQRVVADMRDSGLPIWVARAQVDGRTVNRVRIGALYDRQSAHQLGMYINRNYEWPFWVARVEEGEPVPENAVAITRAFLEDIR